MKLKHATIRNFKGIRDLEIDFELPYSGAPRQLTCLIGDNGSGKTTALQAIALTLSLATRRTPSPGLFDWPGFVAERIGSLGATRVELDVTFEPSEIGPTQELFRIWAYIQNSQATAGTSFDASPPSDRREVRIIYENGRVFSPGPSGRNRLNQFRGRAYLSDIIAAQPERNRDLAKLGDIFWFDQNRSIGSSINSSNGQARSLVLRDG